MLECKKVNEEVKDLYLEQAVLLKFAKTGITPGDPLEGTNGTDNSKIVEKHWKCPHCNTFNPMKENFCKKCRMSSYFKLECEKCNLVSGGFTCLSCGSKNSNIL